ncbi:MAG: tRNA (guanosine(37)-N1)-methyltransferase TrmD [Magnetovibrio sp.]|nr:tRNA (guanosine(37)-N1)-methyltransferase TrmD [Magnetovibrio sp.]
MKLNTPNSVWNVHILTAFPEMFPGPLECSLAGQALASNIWAMRTWDFRKFTKDPHHSIDDKPYGGGSGMVMRPDVVGEGISKVSKVASHLPLVYLTPHGKKITQQTVIKLAEGAGLIAICGRFEGIDSRVMEVFPGQELSLGDYILSGGEPAAIALVDACVRLLPGVIGDPSSLKEESFKDGLLEYPQYTRPQEWQGQQVPETLVSGNHKKIQDWRLSRSKEITKTRRPDLWEDYLGRHS